MQHATCKRDLAPIEQHQQQHHGVNEFIESRSSITVETGNSVDLLRFLICTYQMPMAKTSSSSVCAFLSGIFVVSICYSLSLTLYLSLVGL